MNEVTCKCKRIIPRESHTGLCQLNHFISYTGNGEDGFDAIELRRIVGVVVSEAAEKNLTSANTGSSKLLALFNRLCNYKYHGGDPEFTRVVNEIREQLRAGT